MHRPERSVAVVTGAAQGIGLACALRLADRGFAVALADLDGGPLDLARETLQATGAPTLALPGSVADFALTQAHAQQVLSTFGRIDVLINNAGISQPKGILDIDEAGWDAVIDVNLKGMFNWCKAVAQPMRHQGGGRIINMSSTSATTGGSAEAVSKFAYCASKAGVLGLTRGLAKELAPDILVNAICPGAIATNLTRSLIAQRQAQICDTIPLRRLGTPEDIAVVAEFLATAQPCFMTGEVIDVDGGQWIN